jgi:hypothetical protein
VHVEYSSVLVKRLVDDVEDAVEAELAHEVVQLLERVGRTDIANAC